MTDASRPEFDFLADLERKKKQDDRMLLAAVTLGAGLGVGGVVLLNLLLA